MSFSKISDESINLDNDCKRLLKRSSKKIIVNEVMEKLYPEIYITNSEDSDNSLSPASINSYNSIKSDKSNLSSNSSYLTIYNACNNFEKKQKTFYEIILTFCGCNIK